MKKCIKCTFVTLLMALTLSACGVYTNVRDIDTLSAGMAKQDVDYILGYPQRLISVNYYPEGVGELFQYVTRRGESYAIEYWNNRLVGYELLYDRYSSPSYIPSQSYSRPPQTIIVRPPAYRPGNNRPGGNSNNGRPEQNNRPGNSNSGRPEASRPGSNDGNQSGRPSESGRPGNTGNDNNGRPETSSPGSTTRPNTNESTRPSNNSRPSTTTERPSTRPSTSTQESRPSSNNQGNSSSGRESSSSSNSSESTRRGSSSR